MEISTYMFAGLGVALSVLAFFLKKNKLEIDSLSNAVRKLELSDATKTEKLIFMGKVLEDRRRDIQKLFEKNK
jgi:hypothetical protein